MKKARSSYAKPAARRKELPPVAPQSTNSAVRKHRLSKSDLEMLEALGFL